MVNQTQPKAATVHFCTYRCNATNNAWRKSREYESIDALLDAMRPYMRQNPNIQVTYQTRTVWV